MVGVAGQGRKFTESDALEAATFVFWKHGYDGASLKMLTQAMGINPPSLYKAFGSKEKLFFSAIEHYMSTHGRFFTAAFEVDSDPVDLLQRILHGAADHYAHDGYPGGCLTISAAVAVTPENTHVAKELTALRNIQIARIAAAIDAGRKTGQNSSLAQTVAAFVGTTMQGMSQQARDGASAQQLHEIADMALLAISATLESHNLGNQT